MDKDGFDVNGGVKLFNEFAALYAQNEKNMSEEDKKEIQNKVLEFYKELGGLLKTDKEPTITIWDDFEAMIADMMEHAKNNGRAIIQHDFPMELRWGYKCQNTAKIWKISIAKIKSNKATIDKDQKDLTITKEEKEDIMKRTLSTLEGKENLLYLINNGRQ